MPLLREPKVEQGFVCLFISHDLAVVEELADAIAVMLPGRLVESVPAAAVLSSRVTLRRWSPPWADGGSGSTPPSAPIG